MGILALASALALALFFVLGGPFGFLNDIANGTVGLLSGLLAWMLGRLGIGPQTSARGFAIGCAFVGAVWSRSSGRQW
jgi:hypothetical protein